MRAAHLFFSVNFFLFFTIFSYTSATSSLYELQELCRHRTSTCYYNDTDKFWYNSGGPIHKGVDNSESWSTGGIVGLTSLLVPLIGVVFNTTLNRVLDCYAYKSFCKISLQRCRCPEDFGDYLDDSCCLCIDMDDCSNVTRRCCGCLEYTICCCDCIKFKDCRFSLRNSALDDLKDTLNNSIMNFTDRYGASNTERRKQLKELKSTIENTASTFITKYEEIESKK